MAIFSFHLWCYIASHIVPSIFLFWWQKELHRAYLANSLFYYCFQVHNAKLFDFGIVKAISSIIKRNQWLILVVHLQINTSSFAPFTRWAFLLIVANRCGFYFSLLIGLLSLGYSPKVSTSSIKNITVNQIYTFIRPCDLKGVPRLSTAQHITRGIVHSGFSFKSIILYFY